MKIVEKHLEENDTRFIILPRVLTVYCKFQVKYLGARPLYIIEMFNNGKIKTAAGPIINSIIMYSNLIGTI